MNKTFWHKAVVFHGHECPGLAIDVRACEAVIEKMDLKTAVAEELVCITETDACSVDAVQVILGCTLGKGNLIYKNTGKQAFSFIDKQGGKALRFYLKTRTSGMERAMY